MRSSTTFPAKLLLFGEYTVVNGGQALALPLNLFTASLGFSAAAKQKELWLTFAQYLSQQESLALDHSKLVEDINKGLSFDSTIPQGYGLGSSGALVAAVWEKYKTDNIQNFESLKKTLATMESFFHGDSSGVDPLVSYCQEALSLSENGIKTLTDTFSFSKGDYHFFLLNTGAGRSQTTKHYVDFYKQEILKESAAITKLLTANTQAMTAFLHQDFTSVFEAMHTISIIQVQHFQKMIPDHLKSIWTKTLQSEHCRLKICGAGGGGYLIGLTKDKKETSARFKNFELIYC